MSKAEELIESITERNELYGSEELESDMQSEASKIAEMVMKQAQKSASKLVKQHKIPKDAQVRTVQDGVKTIDYALQLFVSYILDQGDNANLDLIYGDE